MISLTCTKCQTVMSIDDAFAGGVCRCQRCGTIQTVPSRLKQAAGAAAREGKTLYSGKKTEGAVGGAIASGTGLDDLATAVSSSGLSGSGVLSQPGTQRATRTPAVAPKKSRLMVVLGVIIGSTLVIGVAAFLIVTQLLKTDIEDNTTAASNSAAVKKTGNDAITTGPNFAGIPLKSDLVVYVLDRGSASKDALGYFKEAAYASAATLGADRKFQIIFWDNGTIESYPTSGPAFATPEKVAGARSALDDITPFGQSNAIPALTKAHNAKAGEIVLVTAKGWELDDTFVKDVLQAGGKGIVVHTVSVNTTGTSDALAKIASESGGVYKSLTVSDLRHVIP